MTEMPTKRELLSPLRNTTKLARFMGVSPATLYRVKQNRYVARLIEQREQLLAEAVMDEHVTTHNALRHMAEILIAPFLTCLEAKDLEIANKKLPGLIPENIFGFLHSAKVQESLRAQLREELIKSKEKSDDRTTK
jgi:hypothetical protein